MIKVIFSAPQFDIECTASPNYKGEENYVVRYGLQFAVYDNIEDAYSDFKTYVSHALDCE